MRGWMGALNWPTGGIPAKQLKDLDQLEKLVFYLGVATLWHRQGGNLFPMSFVSADTWLVLLGCSYGGNPVFP